MSQTAFIYHRFRANFVASSTWILKCNIKYFLPVNVLLLTFALSNWGVTSALPLISPSAKHFTVAYRWGVRRPSITIENLIHSTCPYVDSCQQLLMIWPIWPILIPYLVVSKFWTNYSTGRSAFSCGVGELIPTSIRRIFIVTNTGIKSNDNLWSWPKLYLPTAGERSLMTAPRSRLNRH